MTIEEMKAKGLKRFAGVVEIVLYTNEIVIYAKNKEDANEILLNATVDMNCAEFDECENIDVTYLKEAKEGVIKKEEAHIQDYVNTVNSQFYSNREVDYGI